MKAVDLTWGKMENEAQCRAQWRKLVGSLVGDQPTPLPRTKSPRWSPRFAAIGQSLTAFFSKNGINPYS